MLSSCACAVAAVSDQTQASAHDGSTAGRDVWHLSTVPALVKACHVQAIRMHTFSVRRPLHGFASVVHTFTCCRLSQLPDSPLGWGQLQRLVLADNALIELPAGIGAMQARTFSCRKWQFVPWWRRCFGLKGGGRQLQRPAAASGLVLADSAISDAPAGIGAMQARSRVCICRAVGSMGHAASVTGLFFCRWRWRPMHSMSYLQALG